MLVFPKLDVEALRSARISSLESTKRSKTDSKGSELADTPSKTFFSTLKTLYDQCVTEMHDAKQRYSSVEFMIPSSMLKPKGGPSEPGRITASRYARVLQRKAFPGMRIEIWPEYAAWGDTVTVDDYWVKLDWSTDAVPILSDVRDEVNY